MAEKSSWAHHSRTAGLFLHSCSEGRGSPHPSLSSSPASKPTPLCHCFIRQPQGPNVGSTGVSPKLSNCVSPFLSLLGTSQG